MASSRATTLALLRRCKQDNLTQAITEEISKLISMGFPSSDRLATLTDKLQLIEEYATEGAQVRSCTKWEHLGEQPSKLYSSLERASQRAKTISVLK